jgi:hypothetical protein
MLISYSTHLKSKCILTINNFKIEVKYSKFQNFGYKFQLNVYIFMVQRKNTYSN